MTQETNTIESLHELDAFFTAWNADENAVKPLFGAIRTTLSSYKDVHLEYKGRPGVSYSLRARHEAQKNRELFVLVDVIDDEPDARWLSICFYADLITDPEEKGDVVPGGLMGEDARCFDVDSPDDAVKEYILERLKEACGNASHGK